MFFRFKKPFVHIQCRQYQTIAKRHFQSSGIPQPVQMSFSHFETPQASAPPLVIMHGLFGSKANWNSLCKAFLKQLNPQRNVISVDARNHGDSVHTEAHTYHDLVEDIKFLMGDLNVNRASLLGHSMGGRAVMLCALKYVGC